MGPWKEIISCPESEIGCRMELGSYGKLKLLAKLDIPQEKPRPSA